MVLLKVDFEEAELDRGVSWRRLESEAGGVDHRHDRHRDASVWQVCTAGAPSVLNLGDEEVLVRDHFAVACRLDVLHHKLVLHRNGFSVLSCCCHFVADFAQIADDLLLVNIGLTSCGKACMFVLLDNVSRSVVVVGSNQVLSLQVEHLLNSELDFSHIELALVVVDFNKSLGVLVGQVDILLEVCLH